MLLVLVLPLTGLFAADPLAVWKQAEEAYNQGRYEQAVKLYRSVQQEGRFTEAYYYNLGNACFKAGDLACARLNYERALRLEPFNEQTLENLATLKATLPDQFAEVSPFAPLVWWRSLASVLSVDGWSVLLVVVIWGLGVLVWLRWQGPWRISRRQWWWIFTAGSLVLLVLALLLFTRLNMMNDPSEAVIVAPEVQLRSAPDAFASDRLTLHAGTKVSILDQIGNQLKVELPNGDIGWLPQNALERVVYEPELGSGHRRR